MADDQRVICASSDLVEGGPGVRFELPTQSPAFVVRFCGTARAFVNRCPHAMTELDWQPGEFFEETGLYLICSTHGALFEPGSGFCVAGPCRGDSLEPLSIREREGQVILLNEVPANRSSEADRS
ncbi:MAG: Rieske 2Fe-2S domain-containing protein [Usitatibacter sp.]